PLAGMATFGTRIVHPLASVTWAVQIPGLKPSNTGDSCAGPPTEYSYGASPPSAATVSDPSIASHALACCTLSTESVSDDVVQSKARGTSFSVQAATTRVKNAVYKVYDERFTAPAI